MDTQIDSQRHQKFKIQQRSNNQRICRNNLERKTM